MVSRRCLESIPSLRLPLALALFLVVTIVVAVPTGTGFIPPVPTYDQLPLLADQPVSIDSNGELTWLAARPLPGEIKPRPGCWAWEIVHRRWNPATGTHAEVPLALGGHVIAQLALPAGLLWVSTTGCQAGDRTRIALLLPDGKLIASEVPDQIDDMPMRLIALGRDSAAIVSREKETRHITVRVIRRAGQAMNIERLPDLKVPFRGDFAEAPLADGRIMVIGGSNAQYRGCSPCRAETHILDLNSKTWSAGPPMLEARSEHHAARLPDGSVLVTGGWTQKRDWGHGPSRTAERWNPATNRFEAIAPMPMGNARHRSLWMPGQEGKTLLVVERMSGTAQAYDVAQGTWRTAGAWYQGSEEGGCGFYPFVSNGTAYAWGIWRAEGYYSSKSCMEQKFATLSALRPDRDHAAAASPPPESLLITYRSDEAFLPGAAGKPALSIGGSSHAGMNTYLPTATVEAITREGRILAMPTLNTARSGATAYRVGDGVLVVGGRGEDFDERREATRILPMEWLAAADSDTAASWLDVTGNVPEATGAIGQRPDGSLLEVTTSGSVAELKLRINGGALNVERSSWPSLNRARRPNEKSRVKVRELSDGRVIVAGGDVQTEKIALLTLCVQESSCADEYVGIGALLPSRRHEIYDPVNKRWNNSAPSRAAGGQVEVMSDGRVVKLGAIGASDASSPQTVLEMSDANGNSWQRMPDIGPHGMRLNDRLRVFSIDDELFVYGEMELAHNNSEGVGVQWLNINTAQWEVLW